MNKIRLEGGYLLLEDEALVKVENLIEQGQLWGYLSNLINNEIYATGTTMNKSSVEVTAQLSSLLGQLQGLVNTGTVPVNSAMSEVACSSKTQVVDSIRPEKKVGESNVVKKNTAKKGKRPSLAALSNSLQKIK